jgi:hypothetical protein
MATYSDYYSEVQDLEKELDHDKNNPTQLSSLQSRLDKLMYKYQDDETLGSDRFGLYQIQAMISFRLGEFDKSKSYLDYSVRVKGSSYKVYEELNSRLLQEDYVQENEKIWWWLIIAPICSLILVALLQVIVHFVLSKSNTASSTLSPNPVTELLNIISFIVGGVAVILIILLPIWIIELVSRKRYNDGHGYRAGLKKRNGVLIAVFLATWYWAYTYKTDKGKFWLNFLLSIGTAGYWGLVAWIWAIIQASTRSERFYALYPYYKDLHSD